MWGFLPEKNEVHHILRHTNPILIQIQIYGNIQEISLLHLVELLTHSQSI